MQLLIQCDKSEILQLKMGREEREKEGNIKSSLFYRHMWMLKGTYKIKKKCDKLGGNVLNKEHSKDYHQVHGYHWKKIYTFLLYPPFFFKSKSKRYAAYVEKLS